MRKQVTFLLLLLSNFIFLQAQNQILNGPLTYQDFLDPNMDSIQSIFPNKENNQAAMPDCITHYQNHKIELLLTCLIILLIIVSYFAYFSLYNRRLFLKTKQEKELIQHRLTLLKSKSKKAYEEAYSTQFKVQLFDRSIYPIDDILYFEKKGDPVYYYTKDGQFHQPTYISLIKIEKEWVPMPPFLRIHSKYLINMSNIKRLQGNEVVMANNVRLKIANRRKREVIRKVDHFFKQNRPSSPS